MRKKWRLSKTLAGRTYDPITRERDPDAPDPEHLAWIRSLPCAVKAHPLPGLTPCRFPVEAHHPRIHTGLGLKEPDRRAIPLCHWHHQGGGLHGCAGPFAGMRHELVRDWQRAMSDLYERLGALRRELAE